MCGAVGGFALWHLTFSMIASGAGKTIVYSERQYFSISVFVVAKLKRIKLCMAVVETD